MTDALVEAVARAVADHRNDFRRSNDAELAAAGFWPDRAAMPSDRETARAALQAIEAAGYRVVPVEATRKMRLAGEKEMMARHTNLDCFRDPYVDSTYAAMLSAAPRVGEGV